MERCERQFALSDLSLKLCEEAADNSGTADGLPHFAGTTQAPLETMTTTYRRQLAGRLGRSILPLTLAGAALCSFTPASATAQDASQVESLREENRALRQTLEDLARRQAAMEEKLQTLSSTGLSPAAVGNTDVPVPPARQSAAAAPPEPRFERFMKGFYGTLDVSFDDTTKGINGLTAYPYALTDPNNPRSGYVVAGGQKEGPVGRLGWMPALSTNKSKIGYHGEHKIADEDIAFIYQIEANLSITSAPGLNTSYTQQSDVVKSGLGYGDSFVGLSRPAWGTLKFGTTYAPYQKSTDRMDPFSGMLGDYAVIMGNTGGDNRVEFGTRLEHSIWYESPSIADMLAFDVLVSPGQNRTYDNVVQSAGSSDCTGGNIPGSGNLVQNCDDGGFGDAVSADLKFATGGFYATAAYEWHQNVNRNSDGEGSNSPIYGWLTNAYPNEVITATNNPQGLPASALGGYVNDIGNEWAAKIGLQYRFGFGLTASGIYEWLRRDIPAILEFQNERSRNGAWLALSQSVGRRGVLSVGWGHAGSTTGDPGGQHNYDPLAPPDTADLYTVAFIYGLDKMLSWYIDVAETINHGNAHYDLGAGGRGLTTDCHDGTNTVFADFSGTGPTTWGGCRLEGVSTGLSFKF